MITCITCYASLVTRYDFLLLVTRHALRFLVTCHLLLVTLYYRYKKIAGWLYV